MCTQTGFPVLTRTTHISLDLLPRLEEDEFLSTIQEESICDHSTFIPSVGELSSTAVIPHQAQEKYEGTPKIEPKISSEHNLTDLAPFESSPVEKHPGSHNPLAIVVDIQGESVVTRQKQKRFPPLEAVDAQELDTGKVYNNPVYELEKKRQEKSERKKEILKLSRSSPLPKQKSLLGHDSPSNTSSKHSTEGKNELAPTKKLVETTRSFPLSFFGSSKKRTKLNPAPDPTCSGGEDEPIITSIDSVTYGEPPINSRYHHYAVEKTRASARTYNEMKCKSNIRRPSRPISSSHSFRGIASEELVCTSSAHDSAIGLSPNHQMSLPAPSQTSLQPNVNPYLPSNSTVQIHVSSTNITSPQPSMSPNEQFPPPTHPDFPSTVTKGTVKEFCQRFESISTTPPTSPTSPTLLSTSPTLHPSSTCLTSTHHQCIDTDSGRESMVELVVTDI